MIGVFLQARVHSLRLPRKVLLELGGITVLEMAMKALKAVNADVHALLCDAESVESFYTLAKRAAFRVVVGDSQDVLNRFIFGARMLNVSTLIRATADNPFVSAKLANLLLAHTYMREADYAGYIGGPIGTGVEKVKTSALERAYAEATSTYDREHVCPYLYRHPDKFRIVTENVPASYLSKDSVTLDTAADYERLKDIISRRHAAHAASPLEIDELMDLLRERRNV